MLVFRSTLMASEPVSVHDLTTASHALRGKCCVGNISCSFFRAGMRLSTNVMLSYNGPNRREMG